MRLGRWSRTIIHHTDRLSSAPHDAHASGRSSTTFRLKPQRRTIILAEGFDHASVQIRNRIVESVGPRLYSGTLDRAVHLDQKGGSKPLRCRRGSSENVTS